MTSAISLDTTTTAAPLVGEVGDQGVDLGAGADVDAAGGLVEQQDPAAVHQPAREEHLLLVAAGEGAARAVGVRRSDVERVDLLLATRRSAPSSRNDALRVAGEAWRA